MRDENVCAAGQLIHFNSLKTVLVLKLFTDILWLTKIPIDFYCITSKFQKKSYKCIKSVTTATLHDETSTQCQSPIKDMNIFKCLETTRLIHV